MTEKSIRQLQVVIAVFVGCVALALFIVAEPLARMETRRIELRCGNNLKQIGLASIQYADDKRFFIKARRLSEIDGDAKTGDSPKKARLLMPYLGDPTVFVCPEQTDEASPLARDPMYRFGKGIVASPEIEDAPLVECNDISYVFTRRGMTSSSSSGNIIAGDLRPHRDGEIFTVAVDAHLQRTPPMPRTMPQGQPEIDEFGAHPSRLRPERTPPASIAANVAGGALVLVAILLGWLSTRKSKTEPGPSPA